MSHPYRITVVRGTLIVNGKPVRDLLDHVDGTYTLCSNRHSVRSADGIFDAGFRAGRFCARVESRGKRPRVSLPLLGEID